MNNTGYRLSIKKTYESTDSPRGHGIPDGGFQKIKDVDDISDLKFNKVLLESNSSGVVSGRDGYDIELPIVTLSTDTFEKGRGKAIAEDATFYHFYKGDDERTEDGTFYLSVKPADSPEHSNTASFVCKMQIVAYKDVGEDGCYSITCAIVEYISEDIDNLCNSVRRVNVDKPYLYQ